MNNYKTIELENIGQGLTIWLNRPKKMNAISLLFIDELIDVFSGTFTEYKYIVIRGRGECFAAGADLFEMVELNKNQAKGISQKLYSLTTLIESNELPVVASVHGFAIGGGFELALACDMVYSTSEVFFQLPEVGFQLIPGGGATQRLTNKIGRQDSMFAILTKKKISVNKAKELGLVQHIYTNGTSIEEQCEFIDSVFKSLDREVVLAVKNTIRNAGSVNGYDVEGECLNRK